MFRKTLNVLLYMLLAVSMLLTVSGCGGTKEASADANVTENSTAAPESPTDEAGHGGAADACYTPEENDVVLEYSFEELIRRSDGLFVFPGVAWGDDFSALAEHFSVSAMPFYPEFDPELWLRITAGDFEIMAIPYFSDNTTLNGTKQCQIMVEDKYFEQSDMQSAFDTLLETATSSLGDPVEDALDSPGEKCFSGDGKQSPAASTGWSCIRKQTAPREN